jgi:TRAP-type mannitol/chloroaromatic compound transport system permease small subunit
LETCYKNDKKENGLAPLGRLSCLRMTRTGEGTALRFLTYVAAAIDALNEFVGRAVSWLTVFVVLNVFVVVVMRYLFGRGEVWLQELYVWTHAAVFMLGAGYTLLHDGHVRIDLIYREASRRYKAAVNLFGALVLGLPLMWLIYMRSWPIFIRSWERGEQSSEVGGLPALYLLKGAILAFAVLMGLQLISMVLRSLVTLMGADKEETS